MYIVLGHFENNYFFNCSARKHFPIAFTHYRFGVDTASPLGGGCTAFSVPSTVNRSWHPSAFRFCGLSDRGIDHKERKKESARAPRSR